MHGHIQKDGVRVTEVETAKHELLSFARRHDEARAARSKPVRTVLIAAGIGLVAGRLLLRGTTRKGIGRRLMGVMVAARLASLYAPMVLRAIGEARGLYRSAARAGRSGQAHGAPSAGRVVVTRPTIASGRPEPSVVR